MSTPELTLHGWRICGPSGSLVLRNESPLWYVATAGAAEFERLLKDMAWLPEELARRVR